MNQMLEAVKTAALEAFEASKPVKLMRGVVSGVAPLKIMVEQRLELTEDFLTLTGAVRDSDVDVTIDLGQGPERKSVRVHRGLKMGEKVLLLRTQGGQEFIVLDRVKSGGGGP